MATTPVFFIAQSGLTLTGEMFPDGSDTIANGITTAAERDATEETNRLGLYSIGVTEALTGVHSLHIKSGSNVIAVYYTDMLDTTDKVVAKDQAMVTADDVYHADIDVTYNDDAATPDDEYTIGWFKNGVPVTSGITVPTIQVIKQSNAADLIASNTPTQVGATGIYKYTATGAERITAGESYTVVVSATIESSTRTFKENVGRDSIT